MVEVNWTIASLEDMNAIAEYIELDSVRFASVMIESFFERAIILETNPYAGKLLIELNNPFIRELIEVN